MIDQSAPGLTGADGRPLVPILTYHSVGEDPPAPIRRWSVAPGRFREHLAALSGHGFTGLTVTQLLACYRGERPLPPRPVVLTFDDGYEDFLTVAVPALAEAGFPATLYVSTGLLRDERPGVPVPPGRMLDWAQLAQVAAAGVEIGAHGHTHRELDVLPPATARWEIVHSGARLRQELHVPVPTFAYPYGYADRGVRRAVRAAGYTAACGVKNAYSHAADDPWALSRILVERDVDAAALTRLVTRSVLPAGWRRERPRTVAWRAYRRIRAAGSGGDTRAAAGLRAPVAVHDVELAGPLPEVLAADRPAHVLVRLHGRPLGAVLVEPQRSLADEVARRLRAEVDRHLAEDGLEPGAAPGADWPCRPHTPPPAPCTSVVVPTCGRPRFVTELVRSLLDGERAPDEILVVDNRPADPCTAAVLAREFGDDPRVRRVVEPVPGASRARNRGLRAARGELVGFLDDDVVADPGWLLAVHEAWAAHPGLGCVTGLILPAELDTPAQLLVQAYGGFDKGFARRLFDLRTHRLDHPLYPYLVGAYGSGANAVFDRAGLLRRGGFDERLGPGTPTRAGEDLDVLLQTVLDGAALAYEPCALVRHHHHTEYADLRRMAYDYGIGLSALFVKLLASNPRTLVEVGRRIPAGLNLLLGPGSTRNAARREAEYPSELTLRELAGILNGPVAFARSARRRLPPPQEREVARAAVSSPSP